MHYDSAYQVGIRVSQNLENSLIADMEYSFSNQPLRFTNLAPDIPSLSVSHFLHNVNYNVSYSPSTRDSRFRPYVGAGVGAAWFQVAGYSRAEALALGVGLRDSWEFVVNWGGGFKYLLKDHVAVTFDVKDRLSRVPSYNLPVAAKIVDGQYVPGVAVHGLSQVWQLNWGFTYQYDRW
jgi:opacity protein-like surface antigen